MAFSIALLAVGLNGCSAPGTGVDGSASAGIEEPGPGHIADLPPSQIASLENLSAPALIARLGPPDFTRRDPPAELWQYRGSTCVLDLFLYPDGSNLKVAHAQSRSRHGTQVIGVGANLCSPFSPETTASTS